MLLHSLLQSRVSQHQQGRGVSQVCNLTEPRLTINPFPTLSNCGMIGFGMKSETPLTGLGDTSHCLGEVPWTIRAGIPKFG